MSDEHGERSAGKGAPMKPPERHRQRLSQIQDIARGAAARTRKYGVRSQPTGPGKSAQEGNAAKLSTVPSSAADKYKGGQD
jgi:hypothetical protein